MVLELFNFLVGGWTRDDDDDDDDDDDGPGLIPIIRVHQLEPLKRGHDLWVQKRSRLGKTPGIFFVETLDVNTWFHSMAGDVEVQSLHWGVLGTKQIWCLNVLYMFFGNEDYVQVLHSLKLTVRL